MKLEVVFAAVLATAAFAAHAVAEDGALPRISIGEIHTFQPRETAAQTPTNFIIEGQIIGVAGRRAVLSDGTDSIRLYPLPAPTDDSADDWREGDIVRVSCALAPSPLTPGVGVVHARAVTVLRHNPPRPPAEVSLAQILAGRADFSSIITEGVITDVFRDEVDPIFIYFTLSAENDNLLLTLRDPTTNTFNAAVALLDRAVSVGGLCIPLDDGLRHYMGRRIELANLASIRPLSPAADDIDALQPLPANQSLITLPPSRFPHRFRVRGTIIARWNPQNALLAADDGRCLRLHLAEGTVPPPGSRVTAGGFLRTNAFFAHLYNAVVAEIPGAVAEEDAPRTISPRSILYDAEGRQRIDSRFDGRIIRLEGLVKDSLSTTPGDTRCILDSDGERIEILLGDAPCPATGSRIAVTGACLITTEHESSGIVRLEGFAVIVRDAKDVVVLSGPPWWTPARFLILVAVLGAALLGFVFWNRLLRRLVERRGRALLKEEIRTIAAGLKLDERTRLAVELHDSVAQNLTAISLQLDVTDRTIGRDDAAAHARLAIASRMLASCHGEIRECIWDLRNLALDEHDMNEAVRRTVSQYLGSAALHVRFAVPRAKLSDNTTHAILRIVRELVANAVRHGKARQIRIAGAIDGRTLRFAVTDDGSGFDPETRLGPADGHFGLQGIRERIRRYKGRMDIESAPGSGTRIAITLQLPTPYTEETTA